MPNLLDLVAEAGAGIVLKKVATSKGRGDEYAGPCPNCGGEDRFRVWPEQKDGEGTYWCRGCERSGDAIQFCMDFLGMSFPEAAKHIGRAPTISVRRMRAPRSPRQVREERHEAGPAVPESPSALWAAKATAFAKRCHEALLADPRQLEWLAERGIDLATAKRFGLGWNAGDDGKDCYLDRASWGLPEVRNETTGKPKPLWLPVGLTVPLAKGRVVERIRIRRPHPELGPGPLKGTRYYIVPGSGMEQLLVRPGAPVLVVVEAELDAMAVAAAAPDCAGALALGSSSPRPDAPACRALNDAVHILVALDFDGAGAAAWDARLRAKGRADAWCWRRAFPQAERWPTPSGKDPGDAVAAGIDLRAWITAGLPPCLTLPETGTSSGAGVATGMPGPLPPGLPLVRGAGDFLAGARETGRTRELERFLERHASAGLRLRGLRFQFPEGFPEALRAEAERVFDAVETEWVETEGWTK